MGKKMIKKRKWITWCSAVLCAIVGVFAVGAKGMEKATPASAEETQGYVWESVDTVSIAPPFTYGQNGTVSFQVYFDKDITDVNYKHMAAGAAALKTFSKRDVPNMTEAIIDDLDKCGIFDSINDHIAFNGKKIREWQQLSVIACMVQVGELGVNNSMNIDLNGDVPGAKIENMDQPFTFTFYEGLRLPSGVELKETVTWIYNPQTKTFSEIQETSADESSFSVYYNGQKITKENNLVTIYDKNAFSMNNLYVTSESVSATLTIEPQFETLSEGLNYVLITCQAENKVDFEYLQVVFDLQPMQETKKSGCGSSIAAIGCLPILLAAGVCVARRSKEA